MITFSLDNSAVSLTSSSIPADNCYEMHTFSGVVTATYCHGHLPPL
jgi:hypothetical protein